MEASSTASSETDARIVLREDLVLLHMKSTEAIEAIRELSNLLSCAPEVTHLGAVRLAITRREMVESTGIGSGVAIPHAHSPYVQSLVICVGISPEGIDFRSPDGQPVHVVVLICAPKRAFQGYLKLLSDLSRILIQKEIRRALINAQSEEDVVRIMCDLPLL